MKFIRLLARILLAPVFLYGGWDTLRYPEGRVKLAEAAGTPYADLAVRANAALMVAGGALLVLGIRPRLSAALLAASLVPTSLAGHPFWKKEGSERKQQMTQFLKNTATIGGLLLLAFQPQPRCETVSEEKK